MDTNWTIDEVIHAPIRLRICGILQRVDAMDFTTIKDTLHIKDSSLSKHLGVLVEAGYVELKKESSISRKDSRRITWVSLTKLGKGAFDDYLEILTVITDPNPATRSKHLKKFGEI